MKRNLSSARRTVAAPLVAAVCLALIGCGGKDAETASPPAAAPATTASAPKAPAAAPATPQTGPGAQIVKDQQDAVQLENSDGGKSPH